MARNSGYQKLTKQWANMSSGVVAFTSSGTDVGGDLGFTEAQTILRVLCEINIQATATPVALDAATISIGLGVFSTDAVTLGGTAMPEPANESDYPWLFWASHSIRFGSAAVQSDDGSGYLRRQLDIRSMRKVKPRESLCWVFQYEDGGGAPPLNVVNTRARVLVGIH